MNERRLAYQGAVKLAEEEKTDHIAKVVLKQQLTEHQDDTKNISVRRLRAQRKAAQIARLAARDTVLQTATVEPEAQLEQLVQLEAQAELDKPKVDATAEAQPPVQKPKHAPPKPLSIKSGRAEATKAVAEGLFGSRGRQRRR